MTTAFQDIQLNKLSRTIGSAEMIAEGAVLTMTVDIGVLPAASKVVACYVDVREAATSGSVTALNVEVGETGVDVDRYLLSTDIFGAALGLTQGGGGGAATASNIIELSDTTVTVLITAVTDDLDQLTAGEVSVVLHYVEGATR